MLLSALILISTGGLVYATAEPPVVNRIATYTSEEDLIVTIDANVLSEQKDLILKKLAADGETNKNQAEQTDVLAATTQLFKSSPSWSQNFRTTNRSLADLGWYFDTNPLVPTWNNEVQAYTDKTKNVRLEKGGGLIIEAHQENYVYPGSLNGLTYKYTSARIDTRYSMSFEYGRLEAEISLPSGKGVWPAFWLLSANQPFTSALVPIESDWETPGFYLHDGELDIMEYYGHLPNQVEGTLHTFNGIYEGQAAVSNPAGRFHKYGIEISPAKVVWTLDGEAYFAVNKVSNDSDDWPLGGGNEFYAVLNLALGGSGGGTIDSSQAPWQMTVRNISFYDYAG